MTAVMDLAAAADASSETLGGKAIALASLHRAGLKVPPALCISCELYHQYLDTAGLRERIQLELNRKPMKEMRWEELWDAALRIRNLFLRSPLPAAIEQELLGHIEASFGDRPVVVRSSAPGEDSGNASFAGLHESFVNIRGPADILIHIRLVWASLWGDAALLYRNELKLDVSRAAMAVVVQELIAGEASGVVFSRDPNGEEQRIIEAVHGLNQGLVDGTIEPDRWKLDRETAKAREHIPATRSHRMALSTHGVFRESLPEDLRDRPPLDAAMLEDVAALSTQCEEHFGKPQDTEWTFRKKDLFVLQSRPITTGSDTADERDWYQSLSRTFESLIALRERIRSTILPGMLSEASDMAAMSLGDLDDRALCEEINRRAERLQHWIDVYWTDLIPFAHGVRLFGQVYNDALHPENPYAFVDLLATHEMASVARNQDLEDLAAILRRKPDLQRAIRDGAETDGDAEFSAALESFIKKHGDLSTPLRMAGPGRPTGLLTLVTEMASRPVASVPAHGADRDALEEAFLGAFPADERDHAVDLLDLARFSYQLRDDDNIYMQGIEMQLHAAVAEGRQRLQQRDVEGAEVLEREDVQTRLGGIPRTFTGHRSPNTSASPQAAAESTYVRDRQMIGQPASPGLGSGAARVINEHQDLMAFQNGEVLVCDAISPTMTFAVPLAAAIVERRGGMLIHGAIIAREYGIPCVTGVSEASRRIHTGDKLTVDGYLGIVRLDSET